MARAKLIDRPKRIELQVPSSIYAKVSSLLYSEVDGRVPYGAMSNLATELFTQWLEERGVEV